MNFPSKGTFILKTLGCKVNQCDSGEISQALAGIGLHEVPSPDDADLAVVVLDDKVGGAICLALAPLERGADWTTSRRGRRLARVVQ